MTAETSAPPVFCAAHLLASWDERDPQHALAELAGQDAPSRTDGTLVVARREELAEFLRHPAVRGRTAVRPVRAAADAHLHRPSWPAPRRPAAVPGVQGSGRPPAGRDRCRAAGE